MSALDLPEVPADDAVAAHIHDTVDGTGRGARVLRDHLDDPSSPRPDDYLHVAKQAPVALRVDINTLTTYVKHAGGHSNKPWQTIAVRDGLVEPDVTRRRSHDIRAKIDWCGADVVRYDEWLQNAFEDARDGGAYL